MTAQTGTSDIPADVRLQAGIAFTITSGRPPRGMTMLMDELDLRVPVTAFNGGLIVWPDLSVIQRSSRHSTASWTASSRSSASVTIQRRCARA